MSANDFVRKSNVARKLLKEFDWASNGYANEFEWLREIYGPQSDGELQRRFREQLDEEGLL